jgi:hypothetical protein
MVPSLSATTAPKDFVAEARERAGAALSGLIVIDG